MKRVKKSPFIFLTLVGCCFTNLLWAQEEYKDPKNKKGTEVFEGGASHQVNHYPQRTFSKTPKNIILMIGDGMGLAQIFSGMTANGGHLFLENFKNIGFSKTASASNYTTDSAAGATALSTGVKTFNGAIGVDNQKQPISHILEKAIKKGLKTGLVATSSITHATPGAFIAHVDSRKSFEDIALDFLKTDIDVFIGGGRKYFETRKEGRNLIMEFQNKGYQIAYNLESIRNTTSGKLVGLTAADHNPPMPERGEFLEIATESALHLLNQSKKGFFLMVEGSQIDFSAHKNDTPGVVLEMLDFDKAIGTALAFAAKNQETLIIVTADHETGGMTLLNGDFTTGKVEAKYTTGGHTGIAVPIFAYGPGAAEFCGFMENTDIAKKMMQLLHLN